MTIGHIARDGRVIVADVIGDATMSVGVGGASDALSYGSFRIEWAKFRRLYGIYPDTLIVSPELEFTAAQIQLSETMPAPTDGGMINAYYRKFEIHIDPNVDADYWKLSIGAGE